MVNKFDLLFLPSDLRISERIAKTLFFMPVALTFTMVLLLIIPNSRSLFFWLLKENNPVELLTFLLFLIGGCFGLYSSFKISKLVNRYILIFYVFFSICLIILAMEEVAWGQWFFSFETPNEWKEMNIQRETTLHNLKGIQGKKIFFV